MGLNQVTLIGNLGQDPQLESSQKTDPKTGQPRRYCRFSVAINSYAGKDAGGKAQYNTEWVNCIVFDQTAQYLSEHGHRGSTVSVVGRIQTDINEKDGKKSYYTKVIASTVELVGPKAMSAGGGAGASSTTSEGESASSPTSTAGASPDQNMDIPF